MDGETGGLVEHDQRVVLEQYGRDRDAAHDCGAGLPPGRRRPDRRYPQLIADDQASLRTDLAAVHPDLAAAQDPVDVALGDALQDLDEVIVDALTLPILAHCKPVHSILA